jgi:glycosyltransferase involved in cell wall biosynthesis
MTRLRVALDARALQSRPLGGVGRYLAGLIPHLAGHAELHLVLDARRADPAVELGAHAELVRLGAGVPLPGLVWLEAAVSPWLRRFGGIFHATFNTLPLSYTGRSVLTLHDLAPQLHAEDFRPATRLAWRAYIRASVARAGAITTVSEYAQNQIAGYFGIPAARILVAPDAVDPIFHPARAQQAAGLLSRLGVQPPYVVAVGGARRRGLPVALAAWRQARGRLGTNLTLVVTGTEPVDPEEGLRCPGFLADEEWATLLAGAQALCYPTRYEGFGLPALEAAASGTPVVCAPIASLPEVLGEAGCWASAPTPAAIAEVLTRVLADEAFHGERRAAGLERARRSPSFAEVAETVLLAYERAAG